jgi:uncharacterized delta-60 repeat protein
VAANSIAIQTDGKIVAASSPKLSEFLIARFNMDGSPDTSFDGDGVVTTSLGSLGASAESVAIQPNGKIVAVGTAPAGNGDFAVVRYNTNGSLDTSFDSDGIVTTFIDSDDYARDVAIQPDGKILVAGCTSSLYDFDCNQFALARYNANGSLDTTFDSDGKVATFFSTQSYVPAYLGSVAIQADGKILAAGRSKNGSNFDFTLVRYNPNGSLDATFGSGGKTTADFTSSDDLAFGMALDKVGRAVVVGRADTKFAIARFRVGPNRGRFDFDGDGKSDISVYRPSDGNWHVLNSGGSPSYSITNWGNDTDLPTPADFDNDGKTDIAVYRPSTGQWFIINSLDSSFTIASWGTTGDKPNAGDFDGDGKADVSIYRPSNGTWYITRSGGGFGVVQWGAAGDLPVPGNYDSDNKTDIAVFRPSTGQWFVLPSMGSGYAISWGTSGDIPVAADYDGDGKDDLAVYRPSNGNWYIVKSSTNNSQYDVTSWGLSTDVPVPGDYDGDGKADIAQYRPSAGIWYVLGSTSGPLTANWGVSSDWPIGSVIDPSCAGCWDY